MNYKQEEQFKKQVELTRRMNEVLEIHEIEIKSMYERNLPRRVICNEIGIGLAATSEIINYMLAKGIMKKRANIKKSVPSPKTCYKPRPKEDPDHLRNRILIMINRDGWKIPELVADLNMSEKNIKLLLSK